MDDLGAIASQPARTREVWLVRNQRRHRCCCCCRCRCCGCFQTCHADHLPTSDCCCCCCCCCFLRHWRRRCCWRVGEEHEGYHKNALIYLWCIHTIIIIIIVVAVRYARAGGWKRDLIKFPRNNSRPLKPIPNQRILEQHQIKITDADYWSKLSYLLSFVVSCCQTCNVASGYGRFYARVLCVIFQLR